MKKFSKFIKDLFTANIGIKMLAIVVSLITVFLLNIQ